MWRREGRASPLLSRVLVAGERLGRQYFQWHPASLFTSSEMSDVCSASQMQTKPKDRTCTKSLPIHFYVLLCFILFCSILSDLHAFTFLLFWPVQVISVGLSEPQDASSFYVVIMNNKVLLTLNMNWILLQTFAFHKWCEDTYWHRHTVHLAPAMICPRSTNPSYTCSNAKRNENTLYGKCFLFVATKCHNWLEKKANQASIEPPLSQNVNTSFLTSTQLGTSTVRWHQLQKKVQNPNRQHQTGCQPIA